ncbi:MAG: DUF2889 domain-containing protein [Burkholderiaceae bacterium]
MRQLESLAFLRSDGLWDLEVTFSDRKARTFPGAARDHPAGTPIHAMTLVCTVDERGAVVAAQARMDAVPFDVACPQAAPQYAALVGLNLFDQFRARLRERLGGQAGCSHLSMLAETLPTLAIQAFAGITAPVRDDGSAAQAPPLLDRCMGLRRDGEAVRLYWPRWHRPGPAVGVR